METRIIEVERFWNEHPCQSNLSQEQDRRRYFAEISLKRFRGREWHVPLIANFRGFQGRDVLEIGCGIGTDGVEFAKHGARYVGVDLTPIAVELARERFRLFETPGRFEVANAEERLPFSDASFDHVYSFGVIHHSPVPENIVGEIHRVLRAGGTFTIMLYNRTSVNYYIEIMLLRRLGRWCLLPRFMPGLIAALTGFDRWKLEGHRESLTRRKRISREEWISMNTDGPFCPLARVYSRRDAATLFRGFANVRQDIWEFNVDHWPYLRRVMPDALTRWIGRRWGWHRIVCGQKV
jgi:SAM-dependent methyltransferase